LLPGRHGAGISREITIEASSLERELGLLCDKSSMAESQPNVCFGTRWIRGDYRNRFGQVGQLASALQDTPGFVFGHHLYNRKPISSGNNEVMS
jgi:hypothetical protein